MIRHKLFLSNSSLLIYTFVHLHKYCKFIHIVVLMFSALAKTCCIKQESGKFWVRKKCFELTANRE
jgi:hypothetical protein